jgi:hypothetical protein
MTEEDAYKKIVEGSTILLATRNLDEAEVCFSALPAIHHHRLVEKLVGTAVEGSEANVQLVADFLARIVAKDLCSFDALKNGCGPLIEILGISAIDAVRTSFSSMIQRARSIKIQNVSTTSRSEIWYGDGSVVLQARGTQFRVYWGVLAQQSSFFRDMQNLPQPPDQPSVDGCPVIELHDDVADVEYLLRALFVPSVYLVYWLCAH